MRSVDSLVSLVSGNICGRDLELRYLVLLAGICNFLAAEAYVIRLNLPVLKSHKQSRRALF
jgi:hypothetical protein